MTFVKLSWDNSKNRRRCKGINIQYCNMFKYKIQKSDRIIKKYKMWTVEHFFCPKI